MGSNWNLHYSKMPKATTLSGIAITPKAPPMEWFNRIVKSNLGLPYCMSCINCLAPGLHKSNTSFEMSLPQKAMAINCRKVVMCQTWMHLHHVTQTMVAHQMPRCVMSPWNFDSCKMDVHYWWATIAIVFCMLRTMHMEIWLMPILYYL